MEKIDIKNKILEYEIKSYSFDHNVLNEYFTIVHNVYLVIIWLSLAEYCKNDIYKCLLAYYHGIYLGTKLLNK